MFLACFVASGGIFALRSRPIGPPRSASTRLGGADYEIELDQPRFAGPEPEA